jgi:hypothetical protein
MKSLIASFILSTIAVLGFAAPALATSGENAGHVASITGVNVSGAIWWEITISGLGTLCPGRNWAYISDTDNNENAEYNAIVNAKNWGSNLYIYWTTDASSNCHITRLYY